MANKSLTEDYKKRFHRLCEMTFIGNSGIVESDDDNNGQGGGDSAVDDVESMGQGGGDNQDMGGAPDMGGIPDMPGTEGGDGMGGAPDMNGAPDMGGEGNTPEGFSPQEPAADAPESEVAPEDDVVDITALIDAQDDITAKVDMFDEKFTNAMKHLEAFSELIKDNSKKINDLKIEFERRNPTQTEKLGLQTTKSYPFNQSVNDFWDKKERTTNYSTDNDENGIHQGQYVITSNDVNGAVDWKTISDSLDDEDYLYNQNMDYLLKM
jgi:hypothetical protein